MPCHTMPHYVVLCCLAFYPLHHFRVVLCCVVLCFPSHLYVGVANPFHFSLAFVLSIETEFRALKTNQPHTPNTNGYCNIANAILHYNTTLHYTLHYTLQTLVSSRAPESVSRTSGRERNASPNRPSRPASTRTASGSA